MREILNFIIEYPIISACGFAIPFIAFPTFRNTVEAAFWLTCAAGVLYWLSRVVAP